MPYKDPKVRKRMGVVAMRKWRAAHPEEAKVQELRFRGRGSVRSALRILKRRAKESGVAFNLTEDWWLAHFSQGCEVTGIDLDAPIVKNESWRFYGPWSAHVDRIKPGGDYTMDNCRIVCGMYNLARRNWSDADVLRMAEALIANKRES